MSEQPRVVTMPLPAKVWSTNEDRNLNPYERAARIKAWKEATIVHYRKAYGRMDQAPSVVQVMLPVPDRRRRDPHNYCGTVLKAVIDGLVKAGAWPDDTPDYVGHREPVLVHKGRHVVITWSPMPERTEDGSEGMELGEPAPSA